MRRLPFVLLVVLLCVVTAAGASVAGWWLIRTSTHHAGARPVPAAHDEDGYARQMHNIRNNLWQLTCRDLAGLSDRDQRTIAVGAWMYQSYKAAHRAAHSWVYRRPNTKQRLAMALALNGDCIDHINTDLLRVSSLAYQQVRESL